MKLLIVDDEPVIVEALSAIVQNSSLGFQKVLGAFDAASALGMIGQFSPDIILTDIRMPGMSGIDLIGWLRKEKYKARTIILSAYREFDYVQQALRLGASDYILKPVSEEKLLECLGKVIAQAQKDQYEAAHSSRYYELLNKSTPLFGKIAEYLKLGLEDKTKEVLFGLFRLIDEGCGKDISLAADIGYGIFAVIRAAMDETAALDQEDPYIYVGPEYFAEMNTWDEIKNFLSVTAYDAVAYIQLSRKGDHYSLIQKAKKYCMENIAGDITLESAADYVGMNRSYFANVFKKETGQTFWNYLTDLRMDTAKCLMETTELKVCTIGIQVGYKNSSHFGRTFKNAVGVTPAEYKNRIN